MSHSDRTAATTAGEIPPREIPVQSRAWVGHAALLLVQLLFGLFPVSGALAFEPGGFSPFGVAAWRIAVGGLVLGGLALLLFRRRALPARRDLPALLVAALLGIVANQGLYLSGLERSTPANAGLLICLVPLFTYFIATAFGQERLQLRCVLALVIAFGGMVPLFTGRGASVFGEYALGNALMAGNGFCYALFIVLSKPLVARYPALVVMGWAYLLALPSAPAFASQGGLLPEDPGSARAWWALAYILAAPTVLAYLLNVFALARVRASTTAFYIFLQPLISGGVSHYFLGEELSADMFLAAGALFAGVFILSTRGRS